ncbi:hypothetical protein [Blastococcus deserti]|uniref:Agenet domain-containing protein n=1 Tax=Blastococcus deserti TaxID=2259033 RepID=A0ABW4XGX0_9ACTN
MSGAMENRAAVFTSQPQAVEVYQAGTWWAGELLGWRHDASGSCQVWVRVVLDGVEETAWTDLESLRLPERHLAVAAGSPAGSAYAPATQEMSVARHPAGRRSRAADGEPTAAAGMPAVRDLSVVPDLPVTGGRRTADETAQFASVGRRRAPETTDVPSGGRRTADETAKFASVGRRRAPEGVTAPSAAPSTSPRITSPGRHRAPADPGRHRTADTGLFPVVSDAAGSDRTPPSASRPVTGAAPAVPRVAAVRPHEPLPRSGGTWTAPEDLEPELLTRPMRLSDHVPHARRPRVDGSLRGR